VRTLFGIKELRVDASEELLIAAVSHDIERAFNPETKETKKYRTGKEQEYHQVEGGRIMFDFLVDNGYDAAKAERVRELISKHEVGGDEEQNILKDADSLSWLEVSAPRHIGKRLFPKEELERKIAFMFERISASKAKELGRPFYEEAVRMLEEQEKNNPLEGNSERIGQAEQLR
jgi:hypothetical protein